MTTTRAELVVEIQLTGPEGCPAAMLRGRLDAAVQRAEEVFGSGVPVDIDAGDVWMSGPVVN